ncbi:hypothetical protein V8E52_004024 [Russula decolorans]
MFLLPTVGSIVDITIKVSIPIIPVFDVKFLGAYLLDHSTYYFRSGISLAHYQGLVGYSIFVTHACCTCTIILTQ